MQIYTCTCACATWHHWKSWPNFPCISFQEGHLMSICCNLISVCFVCNHWINHWGVQFWEAIWGHSPLYFDLACQSPLGTHFNNTELSKHQTAYCEKLKCEYLQNVLFLALVSTLLWREKDNTVGKMLMYRILKGMHSWKGQNFTDNCIPDISGDGKRNLWYRFGSFSQVQGGSFKKLVVLKRDTGGGTVGCTAVVCGAGYTL